MIEEFHIITKPKIGSLDLIGHSEKNLGTYPKPF